MKIIGFVHTDSGVQMVLKGDSCLLNGSKPFFVPDGCGPIGVTECMILRVSRLGKEIERRFAERYYDAIAYGADFVAIDMLRAAQRDGRAWTEAIAFDYSLAIGQWIEKGEMKENEWVMSPDEAIEQASRLMTIRQGDLIYIQSNQSPREVHKEEIISTSYKGEEILHCKIK